MSNDIKWRCPVCDTWNTESECILCGEKRPDMILSSNERDVNMKSENCDEVNQVFNSQKSLKDVQYGSKDTSHSGVHINESADSGKKKKVPMIAAASICTVAVIITVLAILMHRSDINTENTVPQLSMIYDTTSIVTDTFETVHSSSAVSSVTVDTMSPETFVQTSAETVDNYIQMPSIIGMECNDATGLLDSLGISYNVTLSDKKYVGIDTNCVYLQGHKTGSKVKKGTVVEIGVSTYKSVTTADTQAITTTQTTTVPTVTTTQATTVPTVTTTQTTTVPTITTTQTTTTPTVTTETTTTNETMIQEVTVETTTASVIEESQIVVLPVRTRFSLENAVMPVDGTSWSDYKWESSNTAKLQIDSGVMTTYSVGTITITATLISDESKVFTTTVKVVRQDQYYTDQTTTTYDDSWFYDMYNETAFTYNAE